MATLTVQDAARLLGIKPAKVRTLISARKLSAYPAPPGPGQRGDNNMLLDADEVEALARMRAHRRHLRSGMPVQAEEAPAQSPQPQEDDVPRSETLTGDVESITIAAFDHTGQRIAVLVQSMLAPLVTELHDARETIRRQAEELGALRSTVAELERRAQQIGPVASAPPNGSHANGAREYEGGERVPGSAPAQSTPRPYLDGMAGAAAVQPRSQLHRLPIWQRAMTYLLTR
jgi:hypothetical protein